MVRGADARRRWCLAAGGAAMVLFFILRWLDVYGDPNPGRLSRYARL
jgi:hypothetical protein